MAQNIIYCSGPLFCPEELAGMARIAGVLEAAGYRTFLPQRDGLERFVLGVAGSAAAGRPLLGPIGRAVSEAIFALDVYQIVRRCQALVFNMNGRVPDEGGAAEAAIAFAAGKPVVIYKDDRRSMLGGRDNSMLLGLTGGHKTFGKLEKIPAAIARAIEQGQTSGPSPYKDGRVPARVQRVIGRGRRIWRVLQRAPTPRGNAEVKALLEELKAL